MSKHRAVALRHGCVLHGILGATLVFVLSGCGGKSGIDRVVLSGEVTYSGQPVLYGEIRFVPTKETTAPLTVTLIKQGRYDTSPSKGVPVGSHIVEIKGYPADYAKVRPGPFAPPPNQLLPEKYNTKSTLTLELPAGSSSTQDHPFRLDP